MQDPGKFKIYVALSRVKKLSGLHILNCSAKAIKCSSKVTNEMEHLRNTLLIVDDSMVLATSHHKYTLYCAQARIYIM